MLTVLPADGSSVGNDNVSQEITGSVKQSSTEKEHVVCSDPVAKNIKAKPVAVDDTKSLLTLSFGCEATVYSFYFCDEKNCTNISKELASIKTRDKFQHA